VSWLDGSAVTYPRLERVFVMTENGAAKAVFHSVWDGVASHHSFNLGRLLEP
jgi:hypothetical protein